MKIKVLLALILLSVAPNCLSQVQTDFDYGIVANGRYTNRFFGIEMTLPQDWVVQSREQVDRMNQLGKDLFTGDDAKLKAVVKASQVNSATLLTLFKYEKGSPVTYNANMLIIAENIKNLPGIKSGKDYLFQAHRVLEMGQFKYDHVDSEFAKETINGIEFYKMNAEVTYMGIKITQTYYSTVINKFAFSFIISYASDEQKNELIYSLNSLKYKK